ncbi:BatA domain-containing protein [Luteolibacter sp. LG18]|uniref:BatA domain-containing protein n=1 Tax=Luteolibacter sp. LG18 TaxID=2819286 RepID=UPI002B303325|nr:hypothetical protein llg_33960 [Luteolibacter sp. LG18]
MTLANVLLFSLGVAAIAAPLWVHLRLGKVKKRAVVSTLRLMKATPQTSKSPRRLVDVPLFLLRALMVLLVALGFGRLLIPGLRSADAQEYAVFVLDVSGSMQARNGKVWEEARRETLEALGRLNQSSRVAVVLSPAGLDKTEWQTPSQAVSKVKALSAGYGANRISTSVREAVTLLAEMPEDHAKVLHVVSDCQHAAFADIDRATIPSDVELRVSKVGEERLSNRGVSVSVVAAGMTDLGLYALSDGSGGSLKLEENGKASQLPVGSGQDAARMTHAGKKDEWVVRKLELEDADALMADNTAYDVYQAQDEIPVWLWEPAGEPSQAEPATRSAGRIPGQTTGPRERHVYEQASYYVGRGLQPAVEEGGATASRYRPMTLTDKNVAEAAAKAGEKSAPRLLIVPAGKVVPDALKDLVKAVVEAGGSVVFFGGPELDRNAFDAAFGELSGVKPGAMEDCKGSPVLAEITEGNPLWGGLDAASRRQLTKAPLKFRHALETRLNARTLVSYADGVPFVVEHASGRGQVFFVNTSADRAWGDWSASAPLFVPALHLLAARALGDDSFLPAHEPVLAGEPVTLRLSPTFAGRFLKVGSGKWPVGSDGRVAGVVFEKPGVMDLTLEDGTKAGKLAVNFPPVESALEFYSGPVVRQRLESLRQKGGGSSIRWEGEAQGGLAWRLCLLGAALLMLIEPVIANQRARA